MVGERRCRPWGGPPPPPPGPRPPGKQCARGAAGAPVGLGRPGSRFAARSRWRPRERSRSDPGGGAGPAGWQRGRRPGSAAAAGSDRTAFLSFRKVSQPLVVTLGKRVFRNRKASPRAKGTGERRGMCATQVAARFPVAPSVVPARGSPGGRRWEPAGAAIPPGSGAPGRADLPGAGAAAPASREPPTGSCVRGKRLHAGVAEASAPGGRAHVPKGTCGRRAAPSRHGGQFALPGQDGPRGPGEGCCLRARSGLFTWQPAEMSRGGERRPPPARGGCVSQVWARSVGEPWASGRFLVPWTSSRRSSLTSKLRRTQRIYREILCKWNNDDGPVIICIAT